ARPPSASDALPGTRRPPARPAARGRAACTPTCLSSVRSRIFQPCHTQCYHPHAIAPVRKRYRAATAEPGSSRAGRPHPTPTPPRSRAAVNRVDRSLAPRVICTYIILRSSVTGECSRAKERLYGVEGRLAGPLFRGLRGRRRLPAPARTVTTTDNIWFTLLTQNPAPIHFDHHYASQTEFRKPLVDSTFTV